LNIGVLLALMATGLTGTFLLATWLGMGGHRAVSSHPGRLPNVLVFSHVSVAAVIFVLWLFYVVLHTSALALGAGALIIVVVALGLGLFRRWLVHLHDHVAPPTAEQELPFVAVVIHGAFATATAVLVVLAIVRL